MFLVRTEQKLRKEGDKNMWLVEWTEWNEETRTFEWCSDSWATWEEVEMIVRDCVTDRLCGEYRITYCGD